MKSFIHKKGPVTPAMNITPLIDIVFLLIVFFMLASTMVTKQSVDMVVPKLENPQTHEVLEENRIVLSIAPNNDKRDRGKPLDIEGSAAFVQVGNERLAIDDLKGITGALKTLARRNPNAEVYIRADASIYFNNIQPVMGAIAQAGIGTVNLAAFLPQEQTK